ncbi:MAG TPA: YfhO family protein, partial [bacterium]|nr:YfhO family protein [bacterium]
VSPDQLLMFFLENPFGYDDKTFFGPNTTMWQGYTGALALILIFICGFFKRKIKIKFSLILMILVSLFMAFGKYNPLFIIPYKFIPGVSYFRAPQRYLLIYIFAVSIFSAYSINFILKNKFEISKRKFLILFAAAILSLAFIIYVNVFKNNCEKIILSFYEYIHNAGFKRSWLLHSLNNGLSKNFNLTLTNAMFKFFSVVVIAALGITIIKRYKDRKNYIFIIFFVVLLIELLPLNKLLLNMSLRKFNDMLIHKRLFEQISNDNENFRVHSVFSCGYSQHITFNQQDILGRTATMYDDYQTFLGSFGLRALELMNVKYIFANKDWFLDIYNNTNTYLYYTDIETGNRLLIPKNYKPRIYGINEIIFAENKKDELLKISQNINNHNYDIAVLPSNYKNDFSNLIFNPENLKIQNVKVNFNSIYFEAAAQTEQFVILSELFYDDWHCYINGKKMPIYRANYVFRSLKLPPGKNSVILKYKPYYFFYFCIISFTVLFILIIYLIKNNIRKQK